MAILRTLDLFSGIGGFSLAARMVGGIETQQFVEINPYCQKVLAKNFPGIPCHDDIRTYTAKPGAFDLITGGFPCQDISAAGKQAGIKEGTRSGLFFELMRIIRLVRPRYVALENVSALLANGMDIVLRELSQSGYDAEWSVVSCADVGGVHLRERVWIVADSNGIGYAQPQTWQPSHDEERHDSPCERRRTSELYATVTGCTVATNTAPYRFQGSCHSKNCSRMPRKGLQSQPARVFAVEKSRITANAHNTRLEARQRCSGRQATIGAIERSLCSGNGQDKAQPCVCRNDDGLSARMDRPYLMTLEDLPQLLPYATDSEQVANRKERLEALGNAVVPHVAAIALQRILALELLREVAA
jgi:DNA (cytosine-5)-methyltransferase 1